ASWPHRRHGCTARSPIRTRWCAGCRRTASPRTCTISSRAWAAATGCPSPTSAAAAASRSRSGSWSWWRASAWSTPTASTIPPWRARSAPPSPCGPASPAPSCASSRRASLPPSRWTCATWAGATRWTSWRGSCSPRYRMRPEPSRTGTGAAHRAPLPLAWWGGHGDRLLFILRPAAPVRDAVIQSLEHAGMLDLLGDHWPVECWHQLVSARYEDTPEIRQRLLQAGARVQADTFRIELDRVRVTADGHAQFCAHRRHRPLEQLVSRLGQALVAEGLPALYGHAPHIALNHACDGPPQ